MNDVLARAQMVLRVGRDIIGEIAARLAAGATARERVPIEAIDRQQIVLLDLARMATNVVAARELLKQARQATGRPAGRLLQEAAALYVGETVRELARCLSFREEAFGLSPASMAQRLGDPAVHAFLTEQLRSERYAGIAALIDETDGAAEEGLGAEHQALQYAFRRYATERVAPLAERIHRDDLLIPDGMIGEIAALGCFGVTIPARYGGHQEGDQPDYLAMVLMSDELSRASFGSAGSLSTRPELLTKSLLKGGTEEQKEKWLPLIASGACLVAVAVTEPNHGSDVAHLRTAARPVTGGWRLNGTKTWCTFAGRADILMVLARTSLDLDRAHRGLSLFIVEKPPFYNRDFEYEAEGGRIRGRAIATLGYRGLHSFEVVFEDAFVPAANLVGGEAGLGKGFYLQMHGFAASRLQTAARALGVMNAAFETALKYARQRWVFGQPLQAYQLTQYKLARIVILTQAARQLTYHAARQMGQGGGELETAMAKLLTARAAEWITREAQQLHGGMGYAEEFSVSRHFVDARLLAIFEGTEEILSLRIIARTLLQAAAAGSIDAIV